MLGVGSTTTSCAFSDQIKKYKLRIIGDGSNLTSQPPIPSLVLLCLRTVSSLKECVAKLSDVPDQLLPQILNRLPLDLDLRIATRYVRDENYWKRRCSLQPNSNQNALLGKHGFSYKQMYIELYVQQWIETCKNSDESTLLINTMQACQEHIFTLEMEQVGSAFDVNEACSQLQNLTRLRVTYGARKLGAMYDQARFGMKTPGARSLAKVFMDTKTLVSVSLPRNWLDENLLEILVSGLSYNMTITCLDLSHNSINDKGAILVAQLLTLENVISVLDLSDNQIGPQGGKALGNALKDNLGLSDLNLRLNQLGDFGGRQIIEGVAQHNVLRVLNISHNSVGSDTAQALGIALADPQNGLVYIDLSDNVMREEDAECLLRVLRKNKCLARINMRQNKCSQNSVTLESIDRKLILRDLERLQKMEQSMS